MPKRTLNQLMQEETEVSEVCCVCIQSKPIKYNKITENFIKINSKFVPIREILVNELNLIHYEVNPEDEVSLKICVDCQALIVNFYLFTLKIRRAQETYKLPERSSNQEVGDEIAEPLVLHTLDIVKNFIEKYSVSSILEDENEQKLIIERHIGSKFNVKQEETADEEELEETEILILKEEDETENVAEEFIVESESEIVDEEVEMVVSEEDSADVTEKFVLNNVEFIERTPEYMIRAYKPAVKPNRPKDPDNWLRNKQKFARSRGEKYVTFNGKVVPAKRMQSPCKETCRFKCRTKISEEDRQRNFNKYWQLASFILQRKFIFEHHKTAPIQRRRFRVEGGKPREYSSHYFLDKHNPDGSVESQVQVCEKMFLKTFDICRNIVSYLHKKVQTGTVQDLRGINRRKLSPGHEAAIEQIKSNPFYHIEQPMPITKLFELYQQECFEKGIEPVKNHTYRKLFAEYNECEFLKQDKIICEICDGYYKANDEEKRVLHEKYNEHIQIHEKCMQRARGRVRAARKVTKKRTMRETREFDDEETLQDDEDMVVEEHLNDEIECS